MATIRPDKPLHCYNFLPFFVLIVRHLAFGNVIIKKNLNKLNKHCRTNQLRLEVSNTNKHKKQLQSKTNLK
jgi:hypothetical protein